MLLLLLELLLLPLQLLLLLLLLQLLPSEKWEGAAGLVVCHRSRAVAPLGLGELLQDGEDGWGWSAGLLPRTEWVEIGGGLVAM